MDKISFSNALARRQMCYTEQWKDNVTFRCDRIEDENHIIIYRLRAFHRDYPFAKYRTLYSTDEVNEKVALQRAEEIETMIVLLSSLFSWISD